MLCFAFLCGFASSREINTSHQAVSGKDAQPQSIAKRNYELLAWAAKV